MLLLGCNLKNDRMISVCFQGNHSNHSTPSLCPNHWCWRSCSWPVLRRLKDFLDLTPKHYVLFIIRGWNAKVGSQGSESHSVTSDSLWPHVLYSPWNSPGQNTGVGSLSLLQGIFLTQGSNPGLPHCRWIPYQLSYQGSPLFFHLKAGQAQVSKACGVQPSRNTLLIVLMLIQTYICDTIAQNHSLEIGACKMFNI